MTNEQLATIEERISRPPDASVHDPGSWEDYYNGLVVVAHRLLAEVRRSHRRIRELEGTAQTLDSSYAEFEKCMRHASDDHSKDDVPARLCGE